MSLWEQSQVLAALRTEIADDLNGKLISGFTGINGAKDGVNKHFIVPQERIVISTFQLFKNGTLLQIPANYSFEDETPDGFSANGRILLVVALSTSDSISCTFNFVWSTDIELDHILNRSANEYSLSSYHTNTVTYGETIDPLPSDVVDGIKPGLLYFAGCKVANMLSMRFATKYDTSASDQSFSPSQMASTYNAIAGRLCPAAMAAKEDYYRGSGTQFRPSQLFAGWVLPNITPRN